VENNPLPANYGFVSAVCESSLSNPDQNPATGPIEVEDNETITCTFVNESDPTAIELASFTAEAGADNNINIAWITAVEIDNAGFNLYRSNLGDSFDANNATRVNTALIASQASLGQGASYTLVDSNAAPGVWYYFLEDVDYSGITKHHGPVMVDTSAPTSVGQSGFAGVSSSSLFVMITLSLAAAALALFAYQRRKSTV
jgi:hypothetical protein